MTPARPTLFLTGTTASGKNRVGAELAARLGGEVILLDSMKVYRGMDVGTDKPTEEQRRLAPHHMVDLIAPGEDMNLKRFVGLAREAEAGIRQRGSLPILVGGTAMYLNGYLHGVWDGPPQDPAIRQALKAEAEVRGVAALHEELRSVDPRSAQRVHPNDYKRIERALEVYRLLQRPMSDFLDQWKRPIPMPHVMVILTWPRDVLDERINSRAKEMFRRGLLEEVGGILRSGGFGRGASQALGYKEALAVLEGEFTVDEACTLIQARTRRFARKQLTWFRKFETAQWVTGEPTDTVPSLADRIESIWRAQLK